MTEHTKTDGWPDTLPVPAEGMAPQPLDKSRPRNERMAPGKVECNACPVLCQISPGRAAPAPATATRTPTACWSASIR